MKIAVLEISHDEADDLKRGHWCDPTPYIDAGKHEIHHEIINSGTIKQDLGNMKDEGFAIYMLSVWPEEKIKDTVFEVTKLLEARGETVLGFANESTYITSQAGPQNSLGLELTPSTEYSVLVLETGNEILPFDPVECHQGKVGSTVVDVQLLTRILDATRAVLLPVKPGDRCGLVCVDLTFDKNVGKHEVIRICSNPRIFSGDLISSTEVLVERTVPGGHAALLDLLIAVKRLSQNATFENQKIVDTYVEYSTIYDKEVMEFPYYQILQKLVADYIWTGTVMDVACGTGLFGKLIKEQGFSSTIVGIDLSPDMTSSPAIRECYQSPVIIETMQSAMMKPVQFDHVVCFGALVYLDDVDFVAVLSRMFVVAQKSITFDIEDSSEEYMKKCVEDESLIPSYNHTKAWKSFKIPARWKITYEKYGLLYHDDHFTHCDIFDTMIRLEKY